MVRRPELARIMRYMERLSIAAPCQRELLIMQARTQLLENVIGRYFGSIELYTLLWDFLATCSWKKGIGVVMVRLNNRRLALAATLVLLAVAAPCRAEYTEGYYKHYGIAVPWLPSHGEGMTTKYYFYNPALGAFRVGKDPNFDHMSKAEETFRKAFFPQPDSFLKGNAIPYASGAIIPFDLNRHRIDDGMNDAAPEMFRHPDRSAPWYSVPDGQVCASAFQNAWTFSPNVLAPEVQSFAVRLPNQKFTTESMVVGALKRDFPVLIPSAFGQILVSDGAKALVCRSTDCLRVFNLTGRKNGVMVRLSSGKVLAIGPGSELVAAKSKLFLDVPPADGIARRGVSPSFADGETLVKVCEFSPPSVLSATGLHHALASAEATPEKSLCDKVLKTSAILAIMKGGGGYTGGLEAQAVTAQKARDSRGAGAQQPAGIPLGQTPDIVPTSHTTNIDEEKLPRVTKPSALKRGSAILRSSWRSSVRTMHLSKEKPPAVGSNPDGTR